MLFQRFFPQNISLLPKTVTEAYANLKKKKTSCNTTLKQNIVMQSWSSTPLISSLICGSILFPFIHHQFIIKVHMGCGALLHSAHFPPGGRKEGPVHALVRLVQLINCCFSCLRVSNDCVHHTIWPTLHFASAAPRPD